MIVTDEKLKEIMTFFHEVGELQQVERRGFSMCGVGRAQTSAEHSFRFALMAMVLGKGRNMDVNKTIKMGLIHDIAESRIGDIVVWKDHDMKEEDKVRKERKALEDMVKGIGEEGKEILSLWEEFEFGETEEAKFARELDKLEMVFQSFEYEKNGKERLNRYIHTFYDYDDKHSAGAVKSSDLRKITDKIMELRKELGYDREDRYPEPTDESPKDK